MARRQLDRLHVQPHRRVVAVLESDGVGVRRASVPRMSGPPRCMTGDTKPMPGVAPSQRNWAWCTGIPPRRRKERSELHRRLQSEHDNVGVLAGAPRVKDVLKVGPKRKPVPYVERVVE